MTTKERLHELVEELPASSSGPALRVLTYLRDDPEFVLKLLRSLSDPVLRALEEAPVDDEPVTEEDRAAIAEGWADYHAGRGLSAEEAKRQLLQ